MKANKEMTLNKEIIEKYLSDTCSEAERMLVEAWYRSFENNPDGISHLSLKEQEALKAQVRKNMIPVVKPTNSYTPPRWIWYVASVAAMLIIVWGLSFYINTDSTKNLTFGSNIPLSDWAKYENSSAKVLKVTLPDGSLVWLQPKTLLSYNQSDRVFRQVNLKGEAFFDVKRDEQRPFLIYSGKMTTKVLGTSFNIKAYPATEKFEVSVVTGKVAVQNEGEKEVYILPKQQVILEVKSDNLQVKEVPKDQTFYWELASLSFDNTPLPEVVRQIESTYHVHIVLAPSLQKCRLSGNFTNEHLATVLEVVSRSIEAEYLLNGNQISLKGEGCP